MTEMKNVVKCVKSQYVSNGLRWAKSNIQVMCKSVYIFTECIVMQQHHQ